MKFNAVALLLSSCIAAVALPEARAAETPSHAKAEAAVRKFAADKQLPGFAVAVGGNRKLLWSIGLGTANLENPTPVSAESTKFRIGSTSKALTSLGLAKLVQAKVIDLDAPVQRYVPSFPEKAEGPVTIRQLAGHLAGIRNYRDPSELASQKNYPTILLAVDFFKDDPLAAPPGEKFVYSTYGYTLLSAAIETASKQPYLTYMQDAVFAPLHMPNTVADMPQKVIEGRTGFYYRDGETLLNGPYIDLSSKWAGGGFLSSANDLVRFGLAFFDDTVIDGQTRKLLWTSQLTRSGVPTGYGMGWFVGQDSSGHRWVQHPGGTLGGSVLLRIYPDEGIVIAMLCNLSMMGDDRFGDLPDRLFSAFGGLASK